MVDIFEWLENADAYPYAPTSPPYRAPSAPSLAPMDGPTDSISSLNIDPSLTTATDTSIITVPSHLAEASSRILVYLAQIGFPEASQESDEESIEETTSITEEPEVIEPPVKGHPEPSIPDVIDGIYVNKNPDTMEIKEVIDLRRVGIDRLSYYLAKTVDGVYYWFHSPYAHRGRRLRKIISDYRDKEVSGKNVKELRNGKKVSM